MSHRVKLAAVSLALVAACASKNDKPPPPINNEGDTTPHVGGAGGGSNDGGAKDAGGADAACVALANSGSVVTETYVAEQLPVPLGGAIAAGVYALTGAFVYTGVGGSSGPTGNQYQETVSFDGSAFADVAAAGIVDAGTLGSNALASGTYTQSGTQLTLTTTCPSGAIRTVPYTSTGNTIRLYAAQSERVYTLQ